MARLIHRPTPLRFVVAALLLALHAPAGVSQSNETDIATTASDSSPSPPATDYLPATTVGFARIGNLSEFRDSWNNSSFGAQAKDPAFDEFFGSVLGRVSQLTDELGIDVLELWQRVDGALSLAAVTDDKEQISIIAVADLADAESAQALIEKLERDLSDELADQTSLTVGETEIRSWRRSRSSGIQNLSFFVHGNNVVFGDKLQILAESVQRTKGPDTHNLSNNANFQHVMERVAPGSNPSGLNWYVNPTRLVKTAARSGLAGQQPSPQIDAMIESLGLGQIRGLGGTTWLGQGGMDSVSTTYGYVDAPVKGIARALTMPAIEQQPPEWVKDDVSLYAQMNWGVDRLLDTMRQTIDEIRGPGTFDESIGSLRVGKQTTVAELAANLKGPLHIAAEIPEDANALFQQQAIFGFEVQDPDKVRQLLRELAQERGGTPEQVGHAEVLRIPVELSKELAGAIQLPPMELGVAVTDDAILFSPNANYLAETFGSRYGQRPLSDSAEYQRIASQFPEKTAMISFQRQDGRLEGLYEQLRGGLLGPTGLPGISGSLLNFDFEKLPEFPQMSRYLQTSGSFIVPEDDGFRIVSMALPPRER